MARMHSVPFLVSSDTARTQLQRIHLGVGNHDESWLQALIHQHPEILPIADIEPGFGDLYSVGREIPCAHGTIDNLFITPDGEIVLVETKLWRNAQMRREVVAQTLDYIAALTNMGYEAFEAAIMRGQGAPLRLYDIVADRADVLDEAQFIDAVSLNLQRGRLLAIVLGDGIRTETESLSDLLQSHAGAHFTFALVELATWQNTKNGDILAIPATLMRTVMIERGIVRFEPGTSPKVEPAPRTENAPRQTISMGDFWEAMSTRDPALPDAIRAFLSDLEPFGVYPDLKASLNLKADLPDRDKPVNFGYISKNGQFWLNPAAWSLPENIWTAYFEAVAAMVGGRVINEPGTRYVAVNGRSAPRIDQLLPAHHRDLVAAIAKAIQATAEHE